MRIHHLAITALNSELTADFYKDNFGFKEHSRFTKPGWDGGAIILELDGMRLEIFSFQSAVPKKDDLSDFKVIGLKHIGIQVENARQKYRELKQKGLDIDEPKVGTTCAWFCFLRDPNGIPVELYEPR